MKKHKKIFYLILTAAIVGYIASFLRHNFYLAKLGTSLSKIHFLFYFLLIPFFFFLLILVHELGHLFSFVFSGIKIRALYVLVFVLIKNNNKWKFMIKPNHIKLIGGLVVPIIPPIKTEEEYKKIKKKFSIALIMGPITSLVYFLVTFIILILLWFYSNAYLLIALSFIHFLVALPMTLLVHLSSKINTKNIYGDYVAFDKFNELNFSMVNIIQYYNFSSKEDNEVDLFFENKLKDYFKNSNLTYNMFDLTLLSYLFSYIIVHEYKYNETIDKIIKYYNVKSLVNNEHGLVLAYLISAYYYKSGDVANSYETFNLINILNNKNDFKDKLLKLEYEHLLNIKDNEKEIYSLRDEIIKDYDILAPLFNIEDELMIMTKKLDFKEYKTDIITYL